MEVRPTDLLWELTSLRNEVKQLPPAHKLQNDGEAVIGRFILLFVDGVLSDADKPDQVIVVELLHDIEFVVEGLEGGRLLLVFLDGNQISIFILAQLHSK